MESNIVIRYDTSTVPFEHNIDVENKFEVLMTVQEEVTPDELARHIRLAHIISAQTLLPYYRKDQ